jgi:flagellar basal-body rod protein FlgG
MTRSLWTGASGMIGEQFHIDTISNNLANINTTGFKKSRAEFEDLLYQTRRLGGTPSSEISQYPTGIQVGLGVRPAATQKFYTQGSLQNTGNKLDIAISGEGFIGVQMPDGTMAYTRDGSFKIDSNMEIVTSQGYRLVPPLVLPDEFQFDSITIAKDGLLTAKVAGSDDDLEVGRLSLYRFINPAGLTNIGENYVKVSQSSGPAVEGVPSIDGFGMVHQSFLEMSNVNAVQEMVDMIVAQRAYEFNSRTIQTSDSMLGTANSLKR